MDNNVIKFGKPIENSNRSFEPQLPKIEMKKAVAPDNKRNIKKPKSSHKAEKFIAGTLIVASVAGTISAINSAKENEDVILPTSVQDFYSNPYEDDYTPDAQILENFSAFEDALAIYNKYSEKSSLTVVEKKSLETAIKSISENISSFEKIYKFQIKAKIVQALGLPKENVENVSLYRSENYSNYKINYTESLSSDNEIATTYMQNSIPNDKIPKEIKKAINDIIFLGRTNNNINYSSINEKYNNMLKFLTVDFEKNEDGDLVISDEEYKATPESILVHYKPIYENLIEKKDYQDGKLKKSQQKRLKDVTHEMYGPLLDHVKENLFNLASISPEDFKNYSKIIEEISGQHADGKADFEAIFPIIYNISIDIDDIIANHDLTATFGEPEPDFSNDER